METISLKLDGKMLKNVDQALDKHNYSTRTEFIRDAIRKRLEEMSKDELIEEFFKYRGKAKVKTTYKQDRKTREEASKELMEELDRRFNLDA